jgi:hypothetical protein
MLCCARPKCEVTTSANCEDADSGGTFKGSMVPPYELNQERKAYLKIMLNLRVFIVEIVKIKISLGNILSKLIVQ